MDIFVVRCSFQSFLFHLWSLLTRWVIVVGNINDPLLLPRTEGNELLPRQEYCRYELLIALLLIVIAIYKTNCVAHCSLLTLFVSILLLDYYCFLCNWFSVQIQLFWLVLSCFFSLFRFVDCFCLLCDFHWTNLFLLSFLFVL